MEAVAPCCLCSPTPIQFLHTRVLGHEASLNHLLQTMTCILCMPVYADLFTLLVKPTRQRFNHIILSLFAAAGFVLLFQLGRVSSRHMQQMPCGVIEFIFVKFQTMEESSKESCLQAQLYISLLTHFTYSAWPTNCLEKRCSGGLHEAT